MALTEMGREGTLMESANFPQIRHRKKVVLMVLVLVLVSGFIGPKKRVDRIREATSVGQAFPVFHGTTLLGRTLDEGVFRDRVTLVSAWRIGCAFCMLEVPEYNSLVHSIQDPRFQVVSFAPQTLDELHDFYGSDTSRAPAAARSQLGTPVPKYDVLPMCTTKRVKDPNVLTVQCDALEEMLGADGFPVTFIVGPDGVIRHRHDGLISDPVTYTSALGRFRHDLDSLLKVL